MRLLALAALLAATTALSGCERLSDAAFNKRVHAYLMAHPEVIEEAALKLESDRAAKGHADAKANLAKHRQALEHDKRDYVANPNGKITVVEFFDYRCGYCKMAAPEIVKLIAANPDVRFVFKELPIFGGESDRAATLALAAKDQGKYLDLYQGFFAAKALDSAAMDAIVASKGLNLGNITAAASSDAIKTHLQDNHQLANALGVNGTPMFFVGDTLIEGADIAGLNAAIALARKA